MRRMRAAVFSLGCSSTARCSGSCWWRRSSSSPGSLPGSLPFSGSRRPCRARVQRPGTKIGRGIPWGSPTPSRPASPQDAPRLAAVSRAPCESRVRQPRPLKRRKGRTRPRLSRHWLHLQHPRRPRCLRHRKSFQRRVARVGSSASKGPKETARWPVRPSVRRSPLRLLAWRQALTPGLTPCAERRVRHQSAPLVAPHRYRLPQ